MSVGAYGYGPRVVHASQLQPLLCHKRSCAGPVLVAVAATLGALALYAWMLKRRQQAKVNAARERLGAVGEKLREGARDLEDRVRQLAQNKRDDSRDSKLAGSHLEHVESGNVGAHIEKPHTTDDENALARKGPKMGSLADDFGFFEEPEKPRKAGQGMPRSWMTGVRAPQRREQSVADDGEEVPQLEMPSIVTREGFKSAMRKHSGLRPQSDHRPGNKKNIGQTPGLLALARQPLPQRVPSGRMVFGGSDAYYDAAQRVPEFNDDF